jgi:hypothetical protein
MRQIREAPATRAPLMENVPACSLPGLRLFSRSNRAARTHAGAGRGLSGLEDRDEKNGVDRAGGAEGGGTAASGSPSQWRDAGARRQDRDRRSRPGTGSEQDHQGQGPRVSEHATDNSTFHLSISLLLICDLYFPLGAYI